MEGPVDGVYASDLRETLRWLRTIGDTIFAFGTLALGWFVIGLKTGWLLEKTVELTHNSYPKIRPADRVQDTAIKLQDTSLLHTSEAEYKRRMGSSSSATGMPFEIRGITRSANSLQVQVNGSCSAQYFTVVWDGRVQMSYPQMLNLVIGNNNQCD